MLTQIWKAALRFEISCLRNIELVRWYLCRQLLSLKSRDPTLTNEKIRSPTCACYFGSQNDTKTHTRKHFFYSTYTYSATTTTIITTAITPPWSRPKLLIAIWSPPTLPVVPNTSANYWRIKYQLLHSFSWSLDKATRAVQASTGNRIALSSSLRGSL